MRLAISNIAWDIAQDEAVTDLLQCRGIDAIDVAPGKYFPQPAEAHRDEMAHVRQWWADRGIAITGMQALLFGTSGLNLFGPPDVQQAMLSHLDAMCRIGEGLGATRLVFGSPKNRDRNGLDDEAALAHAVPFFRRLGDMAAQHGVIICLEPNPTRYGANFMTTGEETATVVKQVNHPAIRMQFDTGAYIINQEDPLPLLRDEADLIGHIHASEPDLIPLGDWMDTPDQALGHDAFGELVRRYLPDHVVTIEMVACKTEPQLAGIARAVDAAIRHYRQTSTSAVTAAAP
jgi:sugar phosphate isomerase/epimerase